MNLQARIVALVFVAISLFGLVGCAGIERERTDGYIRPASSATVRLYIPTSLKVQISSSWPIGDRERDLARKELVAMFNDIEKQLNAQLTDALAQRGLQAGDDLVIAIDVESAQHTEYGPGAIVNVRALFKNSPKGSTVWSFKFDAWPTAFDARDQVASKFVRKIMNEVQDKGMLAPSRK